MDALTSFFISNILDKDSPNIEHFKILSNAVDFNNLTNSQAFKLVAFLMYIESHTLSIMIKSYQHLKENFAPVNDLSRISDKGRKLLSQMDDQADFINAPLSEASINSIKLAISCMRGRRRMDEWTKFIPKIKSAVIKIVFIYVPSEKQSSEEVKFNGSIPFDLLCTQLQEFATNKNSDTHPSTWFDQDAFKSRIDSISADYKKRKEQESILRSSGLISSWVNSLSSFECLENGVASALSVGVQTDKDFGLTVCPQSTPEKAKQTKTLLPQGIRTFLDDDDSIIFDVPTPPDEAERKASVNVRNLRNISLTLNDDPEASMQRRRIPWTLSETLALWHEVQEALPDPPSWAKIRDKVFASSRRTNVDLKDRWRVIQRDKVLQKEIRLYYDKWLAGKKKSPTK